MAISRAWNNGRVPGQLVEGKQKFSGFLLLGWLALDWAEYKTSLKLLPMLVAVCICNTCCFCTGTWTTFRSTSSARDIGLLFKGSSTSIN